MPSPLPRESKLNSTARRPGFQIRIRVDQRVVTDQDHYHFAYSQYLILASLTPHCDALRGIAGCNAVNNICGEHARTPEEHVLSI